VRACQIQQAYAAKGRIQAATVPEVAVESKEWNLVYKKRLKFPEYVREI
jgi:hypothetical protein